MLNQKMTKAQKMRMQMNGGKNIGGIDPAKLTSNNLHDFENENNKVHLKRDNSRRVAI